MTEIHLFGITGTYLHMHLVKEMPLAKDGRQINPLSTCLKAVG